MGKPAPVYATLEAIFSMERELCYPRNFKPTSLDGTATVIGMDMHHAVAVQQLLEDTGREGKKCSIEQRLQIVKLDDHNPELRQ